MTLTGVEVEQSFYNLAKEQNIENDDLPDNVSNAIFNITQLTKTVEKLSSRANEVSKLMPEGDTEKKILDIDNFGEKSLEDKQNNITPLNDTSDQDGFDPNSPILQEQDTSTDKIDLNESSTDQDEQVNSNPASSEKLSSSEASANSDQGIASVKEDSSELNSSNESKTVEQTMQASSSSYQITALCNAITQLQQQIEALATQQEQTNMQVRAQANNTLAMTMQLEQINTKLDILSHVIAESDASKNVTSTTTTL